MADKKEFPRHKLCGICFDIWNTITLSGHLSYRKFEKVQKRDTKMIQGMGNFKYSERLRQLNLPTSAYRRNRGDIIVTYKLLSGLYDEQVSATSLQNC